MEEHHPSRFPNQNTTTNNGMYKPTVKKMEQIIHGAKTRLMKLLQEHHKKQSKALKERIEVLQHSRRQGDANTADRSMNILQDSLKSLKQTLEKKRTRKLTPLLQDRTLRQKSRRRFHRTPPTSNTQNTDPPRTVVNLSNTELSKPEISLLSKGLKYAPKPPKINTFQLK